MVGGGVSGLATALALQRASMPFRILDGGAGPIQHPSAHQIWVTGHLALARLGLAADAVCARGVPIEEFAFLSARGAPLRRVPLGDFARRHGLPPPLMIRREELIELLSAPLRGAIEWGARVDGFTQDEDGVSLRLKDGQVVRGSLLVGADGLDSPIRSTLLPQTSARLAPYEYLRAFVRFAAPEPHSLVFMLGARGRFIIHPLADGWVYWAGVLNAAGGGAAAGSRKQELLDRLRDLAPPAAPMIETTDEDAISRSRVRDLPPLESWGHGRVTLLGGAAHATTPFLGRGVSEALEDAVALAEALTNADGLAGNVTAALRAYEAGRRPAAVAIQKRAWKIGRLMTVDNPLLRAARDVGLRTVGGRGLAKGMAREFALLGAAEKARRPPAPVT